MKKVIQLLTVIMVMSMGAFAQQDTAANKELLGKYKFAPGSVVEDVTVYYDNGVLSMSSSAGNSTIEKVKGDTFNILSFNGIAVFKRNEAKKITGIHIDASGYVLDGEKEETPAKYTHAIAVQASLTEDKFKSTGNKAIVQYSGIKN